jgi:UDPglucose 6-dehydrogenase
MNELAVLCEKTGADIELVRNGIGSDSRIGRAFLFAGVGFGGSCFPKDIRALIHTGQQHDMEMKIADAVKKVNLESHERFAKTVIDYFHDEADKKLLAVWGLAFKAKTDDIRESPAIFCIKKFLEAGFSIKVYDPEAANNAQKELQGKFQICHNGYEALKNADALVILTDWQEFRNPDFRNIVNSLKTPIVFDGRNLYDLDVIRQVGLEYHSIGRPPVLKNT